MQEEEEGWASGERGAAPSPGWETAGTCWGSELLTGESSSPHPLGNRSSSPRPPKLERRVLRVGLELRGETEVIHQQL